MKLLSYADAGGLPRVGALLADGTQVADLALAAQRAGDPQPATYAAMQALIEGGDAAVERASRLLESARADEATVPLAGLKLLSPVPRPLSLRDCVGFLPHLVNSARNSVFGPAMRRIDIAYERLTGQSLVRRMAPTAWERPVYYLINVCTVVGHDADVTIPPYTREMDYELEWAACIGKAGRDIPAVHAREHIFGYTIFNDFTARDVQFEEAKGRLGFQKGKSFDGGNVLGPCLVTSDEIPDPYDLDMRASVNGVEWSRGNTRQRDWSFEEMIAFMSRSETLQPGEFIASGTLPGGCGLELGRRLQAGDVVELSVEKIGTLRNRLASGGTYEALPLRQASTT